MANHNDKSIELLAFGRALRNIRKEKKLTQDELSLYSRVDRSYISELENGEKAPTLLTITALARALHVKASFLIEGYEKELGDHEFWA
ncbi:helix-turn-helix transcriptional regulator [Yersinia pestis]|nr:helix-turn-helix transcriptional regulator [Yersinia pestis]